MKHGIKKIEDLKKLGKADVHIHSNYSDGQPTIAEILDYVEKETDLDVIAITDHNTIQGALEAQNIVKNKNYRFEIIIGEEISTTEGHILGLFLSQAIPKGLTPHQALLEIKKQDGMAIMPHPFEHSEMMLPNQLTMDGVGAKTLIAERHFYKAIEVVNATPTLGEENIRASLINSTILGKSETGSSDAHIVEAIGHGYTLFEGKTAEDFRRALYHHQTKAMHSAWTIFALFRYLFFFIPLGWRMLWYTFWHYKSAKQYKYNFNKGEK